MSMNYTIPPNWDKKDVLWIEFKAYTLPEMRSYVPYTKNPDESMVGKIIGTWKFIAPKEILEDIQHSWDETETMFSRLSKKHITFKKGTQESEEIIDKTYSAIKKNLQGNSFSVSEFYKSIDVKVPPYKMDLPVIYTNSKRLKYSLSFSLALLPNGDKGISIDQRAKEEIFEPIRELEKMTCASMEEEFTKIKFPAVFAIKTVGSDIINIPRAVLTSVQPTWKSPYVGGYPMSCDLQITFLNMLPLYTNNFSGNKVTTNNLNN